jgi:hypothetical protein
MAFMRPLRLQALHEEFGFPIVLVPVSPCVFAFRPSALLACRHCLER